MKETVPVFWNLFLTQVNTGDIYYETLLHKFIIDFPSSIKSHDYGYPLFLHINFTTEYFLQTQTIYQDRKGRRK